MARPRKPAGMQTKHLTIAEKQDKERAEGSVTVGNEQLARAPNWLIDKVATREFKRIVKEFNGIEIVGNLDLNNIAAYCNAYSMYRKATEELKDSPLIVSAPTPNGGYVKKENPLIKIQRNYADEMRKFAALCGLTLDSRIKAGTRKVEREDNEIELEFGDI